MNKRTDVRSAQLAFLILCQLVLASAAPFVSAALTGYWRVLAVKTVYALSFVLPYAVWCYAFRPIGDPREKHIYCEFKIPAFFVAFAFIVAALQINVLLLQLIGYRSGTGTGPFDGFFGMLFSFVMFVLFPVITEELFARCAIFRMAGGGFRAAIFCGVIFGVCHFNAPQLIYYVGAGIVLSLLVLYTDDVRLSFCLHFAVNSVTLGLSYLSRWLPAGWYVAIETVVWLSVLIAGIYFGWILLRDHQGQIRRKHEQISRCRSDVTFRELVSPPLLILYGLILLAIVLRCL